MSKPSRSSRHRSREAALQVLFAIDLRERKAGEPADPQALFDDVGSHFEMPEGAKVFAKELVCETHRRRDDLDSLISRHARNWRIERMGTVDRNILRLGVWELSNTDTPPAVIIDEAVELAQRYGDDRTPSFVNGVLDAVARSIAEGAP